MILWQTGIMKAYSIDLRTKVVAAIERGEPRATAAATFGVSRATIMRWLRRHRAGTLKPRPIPGRPARLSAALATGLEAQLRARPDATVAEHCVAWEQMTGQAVRPTTLRRAVARLSCTHKKRA